LYKYGDYTNEDCYGFTMSKNDGQNKPRYVSGPPTCRGCENNRRGDAHTAWSYATASLLADQLLAALIPPLALSVMLPTSSAPLKNSSKLAIHPNSTSMGGIGGT